MPLMALVAGLQGCGGGGGGGSSDATALVALNIESAGPAAGFGLTLGDLVVALASVESDAVRASIADASADASRSCSNGGVVQGVWVDNGDGQRGAGDALKIQYQDCAVAQIGSILTGELLVSITAKTVLGHELTVDYGSGLLLIDFSDRSESRVYAVR